MKIKNLKTGKIEDRADAFAARLIEQGRATAASAVAAPAPGKPRKAHAAPAAPAPEAKKE